MLHWLALYSVTWAVKVKNNINEWQHHDSDSLEKIDFLINTESSNLAHHQRRDKLPHDAAEGVRDDGARVLDELGVVLAQVERLGQQHAGLALGYDLSA